MHPNWRSLATAEISWKQFVREGTPDTSPRKSKPKRNEKTKATPLTGREAKKIYEDVVGTSKHNNNADLSVCVGNNSADVQGDLNRKIKQEILDSDDTVLFESSNRSDITSPTSPMTVTLSDINHLMKSSQENDAVNVAKILAKGVDINVTDQYGWTALMCASCAGALDVVRLLVNMGAEVEVRDKKYDTCLTLAKQKRHTAIVKIIRDHSLGKRAEEASSYRGRKDKASSEKFHCDVCKRDFCDTTMKNHLSSTVHLFNLRPKPFGTIYGISEANKGYQILLKSGWDKERGLGRDGMGSKFPCKTVLKRDRTGIGKTQVEPRVTHFGPREEAAVSSERKPRETDKRIRKKCISDDKRKDMELRRELS